MWPLVPLAQWLETTQPPPKSPSPPRTILLRNGRRRSLLHRQSAAPRSTMHTHSCGHLVRSRPPRHIHGCLHSAAPLCSLKKDTDRFQLSGHLLTNGLQEVNIDKHNFSPKTPNHYLADCIVKLSFWIIGLWCLLPKQLEKIINIRSVLSFILY